MAKKIFTSDADIAEFMRIAHEQLVEESRQLRKRKFQGSQSAGVTFKLNFKEQRDDRKATLKFSPKAWLKIFALVHTYSTEIEWHGVVERLSANTFYIKDILVFPHRVTGSTVTSDQAEYEKWLNTLDDETFNALRFHGHSHVNMGVTPSTVDTDYRGNILNNFGTPSENSDFYYIFLIFNKKGDISGEIYDLQYDSLYSLAAGINEIDIVVEESDLLTELSALLGEAKKLVQENTYYRSTGFYGGEHNNGYAYTPSYRSDNASSKSSKVGAKTAARQSSVFDDKDEDDAIGYPYYDRDYYGGY